MAIRYSCIRLLSKRTSFPLALTVLLAACGAGQPGEYDNVDLEALAQNAVASASVAGTNAPAVGTVESTAAEAENSAPQLGAAAAALPEQQQEQQPVSLAPEASVEVSEVVASVDTTTPVEEVVDAIAAVVDQAPEAVDVTGIANETYSENEAEEGADSVSILGCVGNLAWSDLNADGKRTTDEPGLAIELIELISPDGDVVDTTSTESGYYQLCALPGIHTIRFSIPEGYEVTVQDAGSSDTADSDADDAGLVVADVQASKNKSKYDIGLVSISELAGAAPVESTPVEPVEENTSGQTPPSQPEPFVVDPNLDNNVVNNGTDVSDIRWGFWTETRNSYDSPLGPSDEGVETTFENYTFAHVKALALSRVGGDTQSKDYVVNVLQKATQTNTVLDLQLGTAGEYGWNFSTGRGNFNLTRWKESIANFSASADPVAHAAIVQALQNGTIRYIFLIDEPNHKRWSPSWDGSHGSSAPGDPDYVSNQDLDEMAASVKATFGDDTKTIVRTSAVNLITGSRRGMHVFEHMTHAYLTISSTKWIDGANKGPNKGFEWFLNIKNNHTDNTTNLTAFRAANIKPSIMIQAGFESSGNPWTGSKNFKSQWWQGDIRYPYNGATGYVKTAPGEMDFWIKSLLSPRDPITGVLSDTGVRWFDEFVIFRADRLPTDSGRLPFSTYPHYGEFLDQLKIDLSNNNLNPVIGIPVDWNGQ